MTLIATRVQNLREKSYLDKYEHRASRYGAFDMFKSQTDDPNGLITPELIDKARASIGSQLQTPVINFDAGVAIGNQRLLQIADAENTSAMVNINFATLAWGFTVVPTLYHNNEIGYQRDFETKFIKYLNALGAAMDTLCIASLLANSTAVFGDSLNYNVVGGALQAPWATREQILADLVPIMAANNFFDQLHIVGNGGVEALARNLTEKGLYNEINKQLQYSDKIMHFTNRIANAGGVYGSGYAVNAGSVGMLHRLEREALFGGKAATGHEFGTVVLPMLDLEVGTYYYESVGDFSAIAGAASADMDRVIKHHYGFAFDVSLLTRYNSRPGVDAEPIIRFQIMSA
jgi:hypothetical protein